MKILFAVHQFFPEHYTGTERLVLNLCKQMQRMGHSVKVLTYAITETSGYSEKFGFLVKEYEYQGVPVISVRYKEPSPEVSFKIFDKGMETFLEKLLSRQHCDVIHVCHPMRVGSVIRYGARKNIPVVLTLTDFWLMCPRGIAVTQNGALCQGSENGVKCLRECYGNLWTNKIMQRNVESQEVLNKVSRVVSATRFLKRMFEANARYPLDIMLVPFGKDYSMVRRNTKEYHKGDDITLGFMSTLLPHKGAHVLLEAYNQAKMDNIRLKIYGDHFGEKEYFEKLLQMANGNDNIKFLGKYDYRELPDILDSIDMLVVPSLWWENSPLVLLRALTHNVPAIVSDLGGMTEVIKDGKNGFVFKAGDSGSLAEIIKTVGSDPAVLNSIKKDIVHPPRIEEEAFEYEKIYLSLVKS